MNRQKYSNHTPEIRAKCGCIIFGSAVFCRLHAATQEMLKFVERVAREECVTQVVSGRTGFTCGECGTCKARALLARIEG